MPHPHYNLFTPAADAPADPVATPPRRRGAARLLRRPSPPLTYLALGAAALAGAYASMSTAPPTRVLGTTHTTPNAPIALAIETRKPLTSTPPQEAHAVPAWAEPQQPTAPPQPQTPPPITVTSSISRTPPAPTTPEAIPLQRDGTPPITLPLKSDPQPQPTVTTTTTPKPLPPLASLPTTNTGPWGLPLATTDRHLLFLVDASGSVVDAFPFILHELAETLERLEPHQTFTVRFYRNGGVLQMPPGPLTPATPQATAAAADWLTDQPPRLVPYGRTTPLPALRTALNDPSQPAHDPDHIILIADQPAALARSFPETERFLKQLAHDPNHTKPATRISTVHLLQFTPAASTPHPAPGPAETPLLQAIAHQFHGSYLPVPISTLTPAKDSRPIQIPLR
ncbi:MAG: hypothetical protein AAF797_04580 [Planctomycetota bacterium]